jgi:hypothetical protein
MDSGFLIDGDFRSPLTTHDLVIFFDMSGFRESSESRRLTSHHGSPIRDSHEISMIRW